jgi:hypothetical protein
VLDGREHGGIITADGRQVPEARAVYTRILTAANSAKKTGCFVRAQCNYHANGAPALPLRRRWHSPGSAVRVHPAAIEPIAQHIAGLEERHRLLGDGYRLAGTRIVPRAGVALLHREGAETTQLHAAAASQCGGDLVEYRGHDQLDVRVPKMRIAGGEFRDEI